MKATQADLESYLVHNDRASVAGAVHKRLA